MKKCLCLLLCILLALPAVVQADVTDKSILELIARQLDANTSYRVQLSAQAEGEAPFFADADTWSALKALLPQLSLNATFMRSKSIATLRDTQTRLQLYSNDQKLSTLVLTGRSDRLYISGDLLDEDVLSMPRDSNELSMLLSSDDGVWPALYRALFAILTADDTWQAQAEEAMAPYYATLSAWLQERTQVTLERDEAGNTRTLSTAVFTMQEAAQQAGELLRALYADDTLLALLRQRFSEEEAALYLEPGMLPVFDAALDQVQSDRQLTLTRAFSAEGELLNETLELPFEDGGWLSSFRYAHESGTQTYEAVLSAGSVLRLTTLSQGEGVYAGEFSFGTLAGSYLFSCVEGAEQYNAANTGKERSQAFSYSLLIQPAQGQSFPAQQLQADVTLLAGASTDQAAWLDADLAYTVPGTDTRLSIKYHSRTASALNFAAVDTDSAVALDVLSQQDMADYLAQTSEALLGKLLSISGQSQPTAMPAPAATAVPADTAAPSQQPAATDAPSNAPQP